MTELRDIPSYFRRSRLVLRAVMVILILFFMREFARGFWEGFKQAGRDAAGIVSPTTHSGIHLGATDLSLMLFVLITATMMSILKEFEAGRFFTANVLRKTFRIGLMTEITCYVLLPLLALFHARSSGGTLDYIGVFFANINYIGGVAGTFIRYLSRLLLIGKDLEETQELTV